MLKKSIFSPIKAFRLMFVIPILSFFYWSINNYPLIVYGKDMFQGLLNATPINSLKFTNCRKVASVYLKGTDINQLWSYDIFYPILIIVILIIFFLLLKKSVIQSALVPIFILFGCFVLRAVYFGFYPILKIEDFPLRMDFGPAYYLIIITFLLFAILSLIILMKQRSDKSSEKKWKKWGIALNIIIITMIVSLYLVGDLFQYNQIKIFFPDFVHFIDNIVQRIDNVVQVIKNFFIEIVGVIIFLFMVANEFSGTSLYVYSTDKARRRHELEMHLKNRR